jgi:CheY-like chemotaxis protein
VDHSWIMRTMVRDAYPRVPIASATLLQGAHAFGSFTVEALSASGMILQGPVLGSVSLDKATAVVSTPGKEMLRLSGIVAHSEQRDGRCMSVSLQFCDLAPDLQDQIRDMAAKHLERSQMPMVIVLDRGRLESLGIRRLLHALGRDVLFAQSSLDAIWILETFRDAYSTILVDHSFAKANGPEILPFLHDQYLDKRRVLVAPRFETTHGGLASLSWSVHAVLTTPWTIERSRSALGLLPAEPGKRAKRVLFVDDEAPVLSGLQRCLREDLSNCETVWVTSGEVALSESKARPFDVVVADLCMPGMDGITLLQAIKNHSPQSKRIVLSGCDTRAADDIADVVLHKPCPLDLLRIAVLG